MGVIDLLASYLGGVVGSLVTVRLHGAPGTTFL